MVKVSPFLILLEILTNFNVFGLNLIKTFKLWSKKYNFKGLKSYRKPTDPKNGVCDPLCDPFVDFFSVHLFSSIDYLFLEVTFTRVSVKVKSGSANLNPFVFYLSFIS
jgi:hypothetical protein